MQAIPQAVSVHTRITKTLLRATDVAAIDSGTSRSQIINVALATYFATPIGKKKMRKKTTTKKVTRTRK